ncbi:hypothetical protein B0H34DRAFT_641307, partial [Crassisporium funariophilum]
REDLRDIADQTLEALTNGYYILPGREQRPYDLGRKMLFTNRNTTYYAPDDAVMAAWVGDEPTPFYKTKVVVGEYSTLVGARRLHGAISAEDSITNKRIGVLNFASAKKPGGGFMNGAQAQEESIARASTLYPSLLTPAASTFYTHYAEDPDDAYYTHAMVYSPDVVLFRNDKGNWRKPVEVDVLTSAAVNAGEIRQTTEPDLRLALALSAAENQITNLMFERIARILHLFHVKRVPHIILGSFGTGVFQNRVELVAAIFGDLLVKKGGRFEGAFQTVMFAILGGGTVRVFEEVLVKEGKK